MCLCIVAMSPVLNGHSCTDKAPVKMGGGITFVAKKVIEMQIQLNLHGSPSRGCGMQKGA